MSRTGKGERWIRLVLFVCTRCDRWFKDMGKTARCPGCGETLAS